MREAIILAGGFGTRLRALVPDKPKPMAPVCGRPFLEVLLQSLAKKGFSKIILSLGYLAEVITAHFGNNFSGMELVYVVEDVPLGTGGAARLAMARCSQDHVYIFNGDTFIDLESEQTEKLWLAHRNPIIVARQVVDTARYGRLLVQDGLVKGFAEKSTVGSGLINAGCYVFNASQLDLFPLGKNFSLESEFLSNAVKAMPIDVFVTAGQFIDIGIPEDYQRAQSELAS